MLTPKRVKHRKWHKGRSRNTGAMETRGTELSFGSFGLKSMGTKWIPSRQIEAARRAIIRYLRKGGKMWIRVFPDKPVTSKGAEVPMGGGKGAVDHYVVAMRPGRVIFEVEGIKEEMAKEAFEKASAKLAVRTKFIKKEAA
ncbi:MAG: 50S ribosomal protein L16 [Candidatus Wildermuthbacteria bacterium]|nr:50S ribosomal protein L16 [Candidatus Wildermuthbacteria bacterium]